MGYVYEVVFNIIYALGILVVQFQIQGVIADSDIHSRLSWTVKCSVGRLDVYVTHQAHLT